MRETHTKKNCLQLEPHIKNKNVCIRKLMVRPLERYICWTTMTLSQKLIRSSTIAFCLLVHFEGKR